MPSSGSSSNEGKVQSAERSSRERAKSKESKKQKLRRGQVTTYLGSCTNFDLGMKDQSLYIILVTIDVIQGSMNGGGFCGVSGWRGLVNLPQGIEGVGTNSSLSDTLRSRRSFSWRCCAIAIWTWCASVVPVEKVVAS